MSDGAGENSVAADGGTTGEAARLLRPAVTSILRQNPDARAAYDALLERGAGEEEGREEIARVLMGVMVHVGAESERLRRAGGGAGLRSECFRRLREGETAEEIFAEAPEQG